ncbi:hypothetical protein M1105_20370 [Limibaculum sp. FT325]|uniref:hypothetical protein n=1 Tax=Thermohalobaculum sediminis TaxID=2939436 RepID=UPI0020C15F0B|nr:hypothetical protein [Limibaculum sediminis]MCL5779307.1 hypothetical protein [Limibaculum sediminis]
MWFDVEAALAEIGSAAEKRGRKPACGVADVANVAAPCEQKSERGEGAEAGEVANVLAAIDAGAERPGSIAVNAGLGVTVTYQLIDRLVAEGRLTIARDGILSAPRELGRD